jgi:Copper type II ascorbate-dependent monooxygenase, C-terminal domain
VTTLTKDQPDSTGPASCSIFDNLGTRWLLGSQDPQIDLSVTGSTMIPPEEGDPDYGLGQRIKAHTPVRLDMHYINSTSEPLLKEGWVYLEYVDQSEILNLVDMITFFQGAINVPPHGTSETAKGACPVPNTRYVGLVTGHFHQNGTRFSVWRRDKAGLDTLIYETYDWEDPGNLWYRDKQQNPVPDPNTLSHGGWSGFLKVEPGEQIVYQCAFANPTDQTITLGELGGDQMCNVFGMYYPSDGNVWGCVCVGDQCG